MDIYISMLCIQPFHACLDTVFQRTGESMTLFSVFASYEKNTIWLDEQNQINFLNYILVSLIPFKYVKIQ